MVRQRVVDHVDVGIGQQRLVAAVARPMPSCPPPPGRGRDRATPAPRPRSAPPAAAAGSPSRARSWPHPTPRTAACASRLPHEPVRMPLARPSPLYAAGNSRLSIGLTPDGRQRPDQWVRPAWPGAGCRCRACRRAGCRVLACRPAACAGRCRHNARHRRRCACRSRAPARRCPSGSAGMAIGSPALNPAASPARSSSGPASVTRVTSPSARRRTRRTPCASGAGSTRRRAAGAGG